MQPNQIRDKSSRLIFTTMGYFLFDSDYLTNAEEESLGQGDLFKYSRLSVLSSFLGNFTEVFSQGIPGA